MSRVRRESYATQWDRRAAERRDILLEIAESWDAQVQQLARTVGQREQATHPPPGRLRGKQRRQA